MVVTQEEFDEWKTHHITKSFFKLLNAKREEVKENLVMGNYEEDEYAKGMAMAFLNILEMKYDDFREALHDKH